MLSPPESLRAAPTRFAPNRFRDRSSQPAIWAPSPCPAPPMPRPAGRPRASCVSGIRAAAVFVLSATIYCSVDEAQCVVLMEHGHLGPGILKVFAMYMIVRGVFAYSVAPRAAPPPEPVERDVNASFCSELSYGAF